jgi:hypothetical protein
MDDAGETFPALLLRAGMAREQPGSISQPKAQAHCRFFRFRIAFAQNRFPLLRAML